MLPLLFLSDRAEPIGRTEGEGEGEGGGNAEADLSETMLPILSDFVPLTPPPALLAGTVLTEMFLPHPAELGNADDPASSALGLGQCDLIVKEGGATAAACFCRASYSAGLVKLIFCQLSDSHTSTFFATSFVKPAVSLTQPHSHPLKNNHSRLPTRADSYIRNYHTSSPSGKHRSTASCRRTPRDWWARACC